MTVDSQEVRAQLETILERDLLGPWGGEDEELAGEDPRARYLVGFIAPRGVQSAPEELDSSLGDLDGEEAGPERASPVAANTMFPRSFGLSFSVPADTGSVAVTVSWGRYTRELSTTLRNDSGDLIRVWRRRQVTHRMSVPLGEGNRRLENPPWTDQAGVNLRTVCRRRTDRLVVELALVNDQREPDRNRYSAWLFQTRLAVTAEGGEAAIFLPGLDRAPVGGGVEEDRRLAMLYRNALEYAVGRNVAVAAEGEPGQRRASRLVTEWLPTSDVPQTVAPSVDTEPRLSGLELDMGTLATLDGEQLRAALVPLATGYEAWLDEQETRLRSESDLASHEQPGRASVEDGRLAARRVRAGVDVLLSDPLAGEAFRFVNQAMALQRVHSEVGLLRRTDPGVSYAEALERCDVPAKRSWRPFQLAFVLLNLPALTDPTHDERSPIHSATVDLLFFPTGGGKTEAYLGLAAYTFAIRRLQGAIGSGPAGRDGSEGVAVLMRYTLRLLTAQQFQRAATLVCACEFLRRERWAADDRRWGETPFRIGLWVGLAASPNSYDDAATQIRSARGQGRGTGNKVLQILSCPWCGEALSEARDLEPQDQERRVYLYCSDADGTCPFSRRGSPNEGLPVLTVDEEIYRLMPAIVIGTVDKLAQLPWRGQAGMIFGRANRRCSRHGFRHPDLDQLSGCADRHRATDRLPVASTSEVMQPRPPDLIIQDELHLISGALGTMVGLYETMVDELCSWTRGTELIRPKIISSTATVRRAQDQVWQLFGRRLGIFPPPMLDAGDTFFSVQLPVSESTPGRRYRGICAHGIRLKQAEIRIAGTLLTATQYLFDHYGEAADPYFTCVAYFNALRELAGMKRLLDDDIAVRVRKGSSKGLANRPVPLEVQELTSRAPSSRIAETLRQLEEVADPAVDSTAARQQRPRPERTGSPPIAVLLATNMLQVGVDVARLGLMIVTGQPKNTAEYIQATSRVGRVSARPGLILTLYNWARPRDLAHFETFCHYHQTFYRRVEPLSVTPFAARAVDRGLTGVLVGMIRNAALGFSPNLAAQRIDLASPEVAAAGDAIVRRAARISASTDAEGRVRDAIQDRLDKWLQRRAHIEAARLGYRTATDVEGLLHDAGVGDWDIWTAAYSLRETEPEANLILPRDSVVDRTSPDGGSWVYPGQAVDDPDLEDEAPPDKPLADPAEGTVE
jgi:hypothetical protein